MRLWGKISGENTRVVTSVTLMVDKNPVIRADIRRVTFLQRNKRERVFQICFKFRFITSPNRKRLDTTSRNEDPYVKRTTHPAERLGERHIKDAQNKMPLITASIEIAAPPSVVREKAR
jgi:hypothetical protein